MKLRPLILSLVGLVLAVAAHAEPEFHPVACTLPNIPAAAMGRLTCGTVAVPRRYDRPDQGTITLAVAILHRPDTTPLHDPVLYLQGGPGFPLLDQTDRLLHQIFGPLRDLILVDQRGTGRSEPVFCPAGTHDLLAVLARGGSTDRLTTGFRSVYAACRAELARAGAADLFGTIVTTQDMEQVRKALGLDEWNVYGVSYGTTVALTMAATHPRRIRAMVLDSVYPPDPLPETRRQSFEASLSSLFRQCAADAACTAVYPALDRLYAETLRRLDEAPLTVAMPAAMGLPGDRVVLTAPVFELTSFLALYGRGIRPYLPYMIQAAHDGSADTLKPLLVELIDWFAERQLGTALAVQCRDRPSSLPESSASLLDLLTTDGAVCGGWPASGPEPVIPSGTRIPTLILSGALDPVTPPDFARVTARALGSAAIRLDFPTVAHGVQGSTLCGALVVWSFIRSPHQRQDSSCIVKIPPLGFAVPTSTPP
jgi:pimeloyl-ACP methyl ester carboxylesterase